MALIAWAVMGGWFLSPKESEIVEVSEVSVISAAEFDAALSSAPQPAQPEIAAIAPPDTEDAPRFPTAVSVPVAPEEPAKIDAATEPLSAPVIEAAPEAVATPEPEGLELARPGAEIDSQAPRPVPQAALAATRPNLAAPRIDTAPSPKPPKPVETAEAPVEEAEPAPEPPKVEEEAPVPQEAAPEVAQVTAPAVAARPKGRPKRPQPAPETEVAAAPEPESAAPKPAANPATVTPQTSEAATAPAAQVGRYVLGSDMSRGEKFAVSSQIENRWNIASFEGRPNWETLVVVVEVQLTQAGKVMNNSVRPHTPKTPTGDLKTAYSAARRAILMAQPFDLPKNKFQDGDWLRIRFNPAVGGITLN